MWTSGIVLLATFGLLSAGCAPSFHRSGHPAVGSSDAAYTLNVALFPWIPDAADDELAALKSNIKTEFERANPGTLLDLRLIKNEDGYYQPARVAGWLASGSYDLVEIDTVVLGDLVDAEVIEPWTGISEDKFFRSAVLGSTIADEAGTPVWWGFPHLMCGYFLITDSKDIAASKSLTELIRAAKVARKPVVGNFDSSWDLPVVYLDALADQGEHAKPLEKAVDPPIDERAATAVAEFAELCRSHGGRNPCTDGTYADTYDEPVNQFVAGKAAALWGYSERLHLILRGAKGRQADVSALRILPVPLGSNPKPIFFVDALVRRKGCSANARCSVASAAFAKFINGQESLRYLLLSQDAPPSMRVPRYLLPASREGFRIPEIAGDVFYQQLHSAAEEAESIPNQKLFERRRALRWLLTQKLK